MTCLFGSKFSSKKGQIQNYLAVVVFLFGFGIISILATLICTNMITEFTAAGYYSGEMESTGNAFLVALQLYDYIIVFVMIALIIGVGLTSFRLNTAPAFFIVTIIMGMFMSIVSYFFNYIFSQIVSDAAFSTVIAFFPRTILICTNLHWIALTALVIGSIALYGKRPPEIVQGDSGGGDFYE